MLRELLRRSLHVVVSSIAAATDEGRLSSLETRVGSLEERQTDFEKNLRSEMEDLRSETREWVGVEGHT